MHQMNQLTLHGLISSVELFIFPHVSRFKWLYLMAHLARVHVLRLAALSYCC